MCGSSTDTATVDFYFCDLELPNVFTPNNDGANDYFQLLFFGGIKTFNCTILNRWGSVIREYDDPAFKWDGKDAHGDEMPDGTYNFAMTAEKAGDRFAVPLTTKQNITAVS